MAAVLLIPFLSLRFGVLSMLDSSALRRAAHFPPFRGPEKPAYWPYQLSSAALLLGPFFASVHTAPAPLFWSGAALYAFGLLLLLLSVIGFAAPSESGVRHKGVYRISRNPMYVSYFFVFLAASSSRSRYRFWPPSSSFSSPPTPSSGPRSAGAARPSARPTSATAARSDATYK